jgi:hypothetical protein
MITKTSFVALEKHAIRVQSLRDHPVGRMGTGSRRLTLHMQHGGNSLILGYVSFPEIDTAEDLTGYHRSNLQHEFDLGAFMRINPARMVRVRPSG